MHIFKDQEKHFLDASANKSSDWNMTELDREGQASMLQKPPNQVCGVLSLGLPLLALVSQGHHIQFVVPGRPETRGHRQTHLAPS